MSRSDLRPGHTWPRWKIRIQTLAILVVLIQGCQASLTPLPAPTPQIISILVTPELVSLQPDLKTCTLEQGNADLVITEQPIASGPSQDEIALQWGSTYQPSGYAVIVGQESLVVIANTGNALQRISLSDLKNIYSGNQRIWPESEPPVKIQPWIYPAGADIQNLFVDAVLDDVPIVQNNFSLAPDPQAMLEAVAGNPGAIGYIPKRWLTRQVKEIQVSDIPLQQLRRPIIAISNSDPNGEIKPWLLCLQDHLIE